MNQLDKSEYDMIVNNMVREMHDCYKGMLPIETIISASSAKEMTIDARESMGRDHARTYADDAHTFEQKLACAIGLAANKGFTTLYLNEQAFVQIFEHRPQECVADLEMATKLLTEKGYKVSATPFESPVLKISWE